jgi:hypothetical protein
MKKFIKENWFKLGLILVLFSVLIITIYNCFIFSPKNNIGQVIRSQSMNSVPTTNLEINDAEFLQSLIGQLISGNLGYLTISIAILGLLAGIFVYFNINPLRKDLDKQGIKIEELRAEAQNLLKQSEDQSKTALEDFKANQSQLLTVDFAQQKEKLDLETVNRIQETERKILERIGEISEDKDVKLKEIILSEVDNRSAVLEKELILEMTTMKEGIAKESSQTKSALSSLKMIIKKLNEEIMELQVYKYSKEGKMGAIIVSIDLLKESIDDFLDYKDNIWDKSPESLERLSWKPKKRLEELIKEIGDLGLEKKYSTQINEQILRLTDKTFDSLKDQLRAKLGN